MFSTIIGIDPTNYYSTYWSWISSESFQKFWDGNKEFMNLAHLDFVTISDAEKSIFCICPHGPGSIPGRRKVCAKFD